MTHPESRVIPAVKICGLTRLEDARAAAEAGADFLGVIASAGYARTAPNDLGAEISGATGLPVVAVSVDDSPERVAEVARSHAASVLQLHGSESPAAVAALREEGPWKLWKALRVRTEGDVRRALAEYGEVVDGLLLDGWHPSLAGGSGTQFPWEVVEPVRDAFPPGLTFIAAGGLTPGNVAEAAGRLRPHVVDVSSGVETSPGVKDPERIRSFIENAKHTRR